MLRRSAYCASRVREARPKRNDRREEMGHIRLGRLPKGKLWNEVVALLSLAPTDIPGVASAVLVASEDELNSRAVIRAVASGFHVLLQLSSAADHDDLAGALGAL